MESWFTCSYGLSREQLEELNFLISTSDNVKPGRDAIVVHSTSTCVDYSLMISVADRDRQG
jgi:hypothetical protein